MNIFFYALIIFVLVYLVLNWFTKTSSKKIANSVRTLIIILSIIFAVIVAYAGRFIFSLPFILFVLPLIKTKAGLSLIQLFRIWSLLRILKRSGRFSFEQNNNVQSSGTMSVVEAYKILNLDSNKKYNEKEINIDRHAIELEEPIKSLGIYHVPVKISAEYTGDLKVYVIKA